MTINDLLEIVGGAEALGLLAVLLAMIARRWSTRLDLDIAVKAGADGCEKPHDLGETGRTRARRRTRRRWRIHHTMNEACE
jgi:hypothetical protein